MAVDYTVPVPPPPAMLVEAFGEHTSKGGAQYSQEQHHNSHRGRHQSRPLSAPELLPSFYLTREQQSCHPQHRRHSCDVFDEQSSGPLSSDQHSLQGEISNGGRAADDLEKIGEVIREIIESNADIDIEAQHPSVPNHHRSRLRPAAAIETFNGRQFPPLNPKALRYVRLYIAEVKNGVLAVVLIVLMVLMNLAVSLVMMRCRVNFQPAIVSMILLFLGMCAAHRCCRRVGDWYHKTLAAGADLVNRHMSIGFTVPFVMAIKTKFNEPGAVGRLVTCFFILAIFFLVSTYFVALGVGYSKIYIQDKYHKLAVVIDEKRHKIPTDFCSPSVDNGWNRKHISASENWLAQLKSMGSTAKVLATTYAVNHGLWRTRVAPPDTTHVLAGSKQRMQESENSTYIPGMSGISSLTLIPGAMEKQQVTTMKSDNEVGSRLQKSYCEWQQQQEQPVQDNAGDTTEQPSAVTSQHISSGDSAATSTTITTACATQTADESDSRLAKQNKNVSSTACTPLDAATATSAALPTVWASIAESNGSSEGEVRTPRHPHPHPQFVRCTTYMMLVIVVVLLFTVGIPVLVKTRYATLLDVLVLFAVWLGTLHLQSFVRSKTPPPQLRSSTLVSTLLSPALRQPVSTLQALEDKLHYHGGNLRRRLPRMLYIFLGILLNPVLITSLAMVGYTVAKQRVSSQPLDDILHQFVSGADLSHVVLGQRPTPPTPPTPPSADSPLPQAGVSLGAGDIAVIILNAGIGVWGFKLFECRAQLVSLQGATVVITSVIAAVANMVAGPALAHALGLSRSESLAFAARSVTIALGGPVVQDLGGNVTFNAAMVVLNGLLWQLFGDLVMVVMHIDDEEQIGEDSGNTPRRARAEQTQEKLGGGVSQRGGGATPEANTSPKSVKIQEFVSSPKLVAMGVTVGTNAAAMGSVHLYGRGSHAAPFATLSMVVIGVATVILATVTPFHDTLIRLACF